ncbi:hypothetical protein MKW98_018133 [Papaver atlanticum]|uniref:Uncharacterized protein n=1 Tax=Papaver atlanticum TaxID=357466 RepID=A0AAD4XAX4_9MAGN|nr:hypothetical protein MKW98_018133 [Papaver atlanticum]
MKPTVAILNPHLRAEEPHINPLNQRLKFQQDDYLIGFQQSKLWNALQLEMVNHGKVPRFMRFVLLHILGDGMFIGFNMCKNANGPDSSDKEPPKRSCLITLEEIRDKG